MRKSFRFGMVRLLALLVLVVSLSGCGLSKVKDMSITSCGFKYLVPTSTRSVDAVLLLGVDNPALQLTLSDVEGTIDQGDRALATFTTGEITLAARTEQVYELPCTVTLADGVSFLDVLSLAARRSLSGITADINLYVKLKSGAGMPLQFKDVDLSSLSM